MKEKKNKSEIIEKESDLTVIYNKLIDLNNQLYNNSNRLIDINIRSHGDRREGCKESGDEERIGVIGKMNDIIDSLYSNMYDITEEVSKVEDIV